MDNPNIRKFLAITISLLAVTVFSVFSFRPDGNLHIIACDVGQGDAILITNKNNQILIDGGPDNSVLNCLGKHMPFWDRKIEMVILTHPQSDHFTGLIEVFRRYEVDIFLANSVDNSSNQTYQVLKNVVGGGSTKVINPHTGQALRLGLIYIDVVNPSEGIGQPEVPGKLAGFETKTNLNDFSIVALIRFGNFKVFMSGDIEGNMNDELFASNLLEPVDYLKVNHHGSKNGLTKELLEVLSPKVAVISAGKNNRYGHPHQEILALLNNFDVKVLRTDRLGDIEIISDGKSYWTK